MSSVVSIQPCFEIPEGRKDELKAIWESMLPVVQAEEGIIDYEFAFNGNTMLVRESYVNADAVLVHFGNVGEALGKTTEFCTMKYLEVVGSEAELAKLREPMAPFNAAFYVVNQGFQKEKVSADSGVVSIRPYFDFPNAEKMADFRAAWEALIPVVKTEEACQYYEFAYGENKCFVREAYLHGEGVLAHLGKYCSFASVVFFTLLL